MQRGRHLLILHRNVAQFSGPEVIWDGPKDSGNKFSGQTSPHFSLFFGKTDIGFYVPKMKKTTQIATNENYGGGMGVHQGPRYGWSAYMWRYHWCRGLCWNFWETHQHGMPSTRRRFPGAPCLFQQDNARPYSAWVTTAWLRRQSRTVEQVLYSPIMGKNSTCKTATIDIISLQMITKCN